MWLITPGLWAEFLMLASTFYGWMWLSVKRKAVTAAEGFSTHRVFSVGSMHIQNVFM